MISSQKQIKKKNKTKQTLMVVLVVLLTLVSSLLLLYKFFGNNDIKAEEVIEVEYSINDYQKMIDALCQIDYDGDNEEEIARRLALIEEILESIPEEKRQFLDLSEYEELNELINGGVEDSEPNNNEQNKKYFISTNINNPEAGYVSGGGEYKYLSNITLKAIANDNYEFNSWSDGVVENPRSITVKNNETYMAIFSLVSSSVELSVNDDEGGYITTDGDLIIGKKVTLYANAKAGYRFVRWSDGNTSNPRIVRINRYDKYEAIFEPIVYNITWDARGIGAANFTSSTATVKSGIGQLPSVPDSDEYRLVGWFTNPEDITHTGGEQIFSNTIPHQDATYYAVYARKQNVYRYSTALSQSEEMTFTSTGNSSCFVYDYPEYYVKAIVEESYVNYEQNASACGTTRGDSKYSCHVYSFDGCDWVDCGDGTECCCGMEYSEHANYCNVTRTKTCPGYYGVTEWSDWSSWDINPLTSVYVAEESYTELLKVETSEKYLYDGLSILE